MISALETANLKMRSSGKCDDWFRSSHPSVRKVSRDVNGQLMQDLLVAANYTKPAAADMFRTGSKAISVMSLCTLCLRQAHHS